MAPSRASAKIKSRRKGLRAHRNFEWPDAYNNANLQDLERFFARYLKGERNGWELTPTVRLEVMDAFDYNYQENRPETSFPLKRTKYEKLYLDAADGNSMKAEPVATEGMAAYDSETGEVNFTYTFPEDTELTGYMKLHLWVAAESYNDADLFINVQKLSTTGDFLPHHPLRRQPPRRLGQDARLPPQAGREALHQVPAGTGSHLRREGRARAHRPGGHRDLADLPLLAQGSEDQRPIAGRYIRDDWFEPLMWDTDNKGRTLVYTGGEHDSYLRIPVIPPRYQDGDYIYR